MSARAMMLWMGENLIGVDSADFDGTNDYMTRGAGLTGAADSKTGIFSCWCRLDGGNGSFLDILTNTGLAFYVARINTNKFAVIGEPSLMEVHSTTSYAASSTWLHLLASWNLSVPTTHLYVNDVDDKSQITAVDSNLDYTTTNWSIGADIGGGAKTNGCLAELYFAPGQYLDFSVTANRRKFISATGKPVSLGADGSFPTGTAPLVYQHLGRDEAVANFATNRGTGGNFSITGTLETGSTSPSD